MYGTSQRGGRKKRVLAWAPVPGAGIEAQPSGRARFLPYCQPSVAPFTFRTTPAAFPLGSQASGE